MAGVILVKLFVATVVVSVGIGGKWVGAQVQHVVGGDRGWDASSDLGTWSSGRIFAVGDKIWFTYSAAQDKVVEVKSKEEYETCDVSNPIKMYTDGLDSITLDKEGIRYFASWKPESCKNGLKLHVEVQSPQAKHLSHTVVTPEVMADGPTTTSASAQLYGPAAGPTTTSASAQLYGPAAGPTTTSASAQLYGPADGPTTTSASAQLYGPEVMADWPTTTSASAQLYGLTHALFGGLLVCYLSL